MIGPLVSVIVPVYKDVARLVLCLDALCAQTFPAEQFEVLVINNDEADLQLSFRDPRVRILHQPKPGSYAARNMGVCAARGAILAFTDSDCCPEPQWLERAVAPILEARTTRVAGRVRIAPAGPRGTAVECYESIFAFDQAASVRAGCAVTANLAMSAELMHRVGLFDETLFSGGDIEWNLRATRMNEPIFYSADAVVWHPARRTWPELAGKLRRTTGGKMQMHEGYRVALTRAIAPPVAALRTVLARRDMPWRTRALALAVAYRLKLERWRVYSGLRSGRLTPTRS